MQFKRGAMVYSADDQEVGRIARIVLHPSTMEITHVVIRQGLLFTEDKVLPVEHFISANEEGAVLRENSAALENLPNFQETEYVPTRYAADEYPEDVPEAVYWYPTLETVPYIFPGAYGVAPWYEYGTPHRYVRHTAQNIPEGTVVLDEGARVLSADGEHVGDVEQVFSNPEDDVATHILISQGLLFKEHKLVPTFWIQSVGDGEVRLSVNARVLETLPNYETT